MTTTICATRSEPLREAVDNKPWQRRLKSVGLNQKAFAQAVGKTDKNIGKGLKGEWEIGVPQWLKALVIALEVMSEADRQRWLAAIDQERQNPTPDE